MSDKASITLCILWEGELREAARLLKIANDMPEKDPSIGKAQAAAWGACSVALHDLTADKIAVMIGAEEIRKRVKK